VNVALDTCRWCAGPHPIEFCPAVRAAFEKGHDPYMGHVLTGERTRTVANVSPRKQAGLCADERCDAPRWHGTPYCRTHRNEMNRASRARRGVTVAERKLAHQLEMAL
jgi:hypothetical protein